MLTVQQISTALTTARADLAALSGDLPALETLLSTNQATLAALRSSATPANPQLAELSSAAGRVAAAKDLLTDQKTEVETARTLVVKLEADLLAAQRETRLAALEVEYKSTQAQLETLRQTTITALQSGIAAISALQARRHSLLIEAGTVMQHLENYSARAVLIVGDNRALEWGLAKINGEIINARGQFAQTLLNPLHEDTRVAFPSAPWSLLNALQEEK